MALFLVAVLRGGELCRGWVPGLQVWSAKVSEIEMDLTSISSLCESMMGGIRVWRG